MPWCKLNLRTQGKRHYSCITGIYNLLGEKDKKTDHGNSVINIMREPNMKE